MNQHAQKPIGTTAMVERLIDHGQDFEWYPTTQEMIEILKKDIIKNVGEDPSILDCGAGDGRVLKALTTGNRYAIEKSKLLIETLDASIFVVGTDFLGQTLIDKRTSVIFSNPPYSEFKNWANKIIREGNSQAIYLILPVRWKEDETILASIAARKAEYHVIATLDFLQAERSARGKVDVIRINLSGNRSRCRVDPFDLWFDENFAIEATYREKSHYDFKESCRENVAKGLRNELVPGRDKIQVLEALYQRDLEKLVSNYKSIEQLDASLLEELNVNIESLKESLKLKISGLKDVYWRELFDALETITRRLTSTHRRNMLGKLMANVHVDFTASNAYAIVIWAIKNANEYFDLQLIEVFEGMTQQANIRNYKSNQRTFGNHEWGWHRRPQNLERFYLDYRIVLESAGGLCTSNWAHEREKFKGLSETAKDILDDIRTVADNLGYSVDGYLGAGGHWWESNKAIDFLCDDRRVGACKTLMSVRAFKNGNLHIKFDVDFMQMLCVEFGRLKGWLRSPQEAAAEMDISPELAQQAFGSNARLGVDSMAMLGLCAPSNEDRADMAA